MSADIISLREYVDVRFEAQERAVNAALLAAQKAVEKAETAAEKRFESVNEFRATLSDQARLLMPRAEAEANQKAIELRLDEITRKLDRRDSQGVGLHQGWLVLASVISLIVAIAAVIWRR